MYNKIFTKILDSSIWLEADSTRLVWLTCIAAMDEDGFCQFASPANLAHRANVPLTACLSALDVLEGPDPNSSDPDHGGRRLERVPGGWMVRNSAKYREMVSREIAKAANRRRVYRHREKASSNGSVMPANGVSPSANGSVTLSDTDTGADTEAKNAFEVFWEAYPRKVGRPKAHGVFKRLHPSGPVLEAMLMAIVAQKRTPQWTDDNGRFIPHPATWLNQRRWEDELPKAAQTLSYQPEAHEAYDRWPEECRRLHDGECGNYQTHQIRLMRDARPS